MISLLEPFLDFRPSYFERQVNLNRQYYISQREKVRPWAFGECRSSGARTVTLNALAQARSMTR